MEAVSTSENFGQFLRDYIEQHPRKQASSYSPPLFSVMMEAVNTSEMSVSSYETASCSIPEDSHFHGW
jgi:hypothetical protein